MLEWLVPICLFWTLIAAYVGGAPVRLEGGGGLREVLGLFFTLAVYLLVWAALDAVLAAAGPVRGVILATLLAAASIPFAARLGFRAAGVRLTRTAEPAGAAHG